MASTKSESYHCCGAKCTAWRQACYRPVQLDKQGIKGVRYD